MSEFSQARIEEALQHLAAEFLSRESNRLSLITVTGIRMSSELGHATILVSVFPEEREAEALGFLKRQRSDFRAYIKAKTQIRRIPEIDFDIDLGEKHRWLLENIDIT